MKRLRGELGRLEVEPPSALRQRILGAIPFTEARPQPTFNPLSLLRWGSLGAAVATIALALFHPLTATLLRPGGVAYEARPAASAGATRDGVATAREGASPAPKEVGGGSLPPPPGWSPAAPGRGDENRYLDGHVKSSGQSARDYDHVNGLLVPQDGEAAEGDSSSALRSRRSGASAEVTPDDVNRYTHGKEIEDVRRKVVQNAELTLKVRRRLESVQAEVAERLKKDQGYVEATQLSGAQDTERVARMTLRVPVGQLEPFVEYLSSLGEVLEKAQRAQDVTGAWVDQRAVVREMRKEEERLVKAMDRAKSAAEMRRLRWELLALRPRIAAAEERFALTSKLAALATIHLTLREPPEARVQGNLWQDTEGTARNAIAAFLVALRVPITVAIWLAVFSPLWVPSLLLYRWTTRRLRQNLIPGLRLEGVAER